MRVRILFLFTGFLFVWSLLLLRAAQLQLLPHERLAELQRRQYQTIVELPARRGVIVDRKGKELAVSVPSYSVYADPKIVTEPKRFVANVSRVLGLSSNKVNRKIRNRERRFVWLDRDVARDKVERLKKLELRGLGIVEESKRVFPNEKLLSQVLGFVGADGRGLEGLELKYDSKLKGESRKVKLERDARGRPLLVDGRVFTDTPAGNDLELTVDSELQFMLENQLQQAIKDHEADGAVGIILDPYTSEILAMANAPLYDPNRPRSYSADVWRNRVVTDAFEPGSTVKTLVVAGAIREGFVKPNTKIFCENGQMKVGGRTVREADSRHRFGDLTVSEILAHSSNIGVTKIALQMGDEKLRKIMEDFGLGLRTGVDLPGETAGTLHPTPWRDHLLSNVSFGHGVTATPLQVAAAYAAIANGGILRKPFIVKKAVHAETGEVVEYLTEDVRRVLSESESATMRIMLMNAASETGTGKMARVPGYPVAGKTGTAQKAVPGKGYVPGLYVSSFAGFIPAQEPKLVIYVAIDNPRKSYYGSEVAAPLFSKVASYAVRQMGLPPVFISEKNLVKETKPKSREQSIDTIREMAKMLDLEQQNVTPDFTGLTLREVLNRVRGSDLKVDLRGNGVVFLTVPSPGHPLPEDKKLRVYFKEM